MEKNIENMESSYTINEKRPCWVIVSNHLHEQIFRGQKQGSLIFLTYVHYIRMKSAHGNKGVLPKNSECSAKAESLFCSRKLIIGQVPL